MSQEDALVNFKKIVHTLLIASKIGLDPEQLQRSYFAAMGHPMPLAQLGFKNILHMVKEMPDVVRVEFRADSSLYLRGVADTYTQQMKKMVARPKSRRGEKVKMGSAPLSGRRRNITALNKQLSTHLCILLSQVSHLLANPDATFLNYYGLKGIGDLLEAAARLVQIQQNTLGLILMLKNPGMARMVISLQPRI